MLNNKLISSRQFGFRPHHSTADLLTILAQTWNASLDRSEEVCIVARDIKGAFDRVWHNGLLAKLRSKGVSGMLLTSLQSYLQGRSIKVVLSGQSSDASPINAKVPQGSILGPLLFSVFIDDLVDTCENQLYLYADDSTLFAPIRSVNERASGLASLNRDLEKMRVWAANWKVTFEPTKCTALMLSRKRMPTILICTLEAQNLQWIRISVFSASHLTASFFGPGTSRTSQNGYRGKSNCLQGLDP